MKISTVISQSTISTPFKKFPNDLYELRWGIEQVGVTNIINPETNELIEVPYYKYELCRCFGKLSARLFINEILSKAKREATISELNEILTNLGATNNYKIDIMKKYLILKVVNYDSSDKVNSFTIGEYTTWLDKATRVGLKLRFDAELATGEESTILWQNGISFLLELQNAFSILSAIEIYASACYDNTQKHIAEIRRLTIIDELVDYDYTTGYPEKLIFN